MKHSTTKTRLARAAMTLLVAMLGFTAGANVIQASTARTTTLDNTVELSAGWNWFSTNVEITLDNLKAALVEALPYTEITIQACSDQNNNYKLTYNPYNHRWTGRLIFDVSQMYMIHVEGSCELSLEAMPVEPVDHPITIREGDNWIGFPFSDNMSVASAFGEIAEKGDVIYSHTDFAYYNGSTWRGTLSALEPGQGYIYHSETWEDRIFTYPTEYVSGSNSSSNHHWTVDNYHNFKRHFPVVAVLKLEGQIIDATSDLEVAAFNGDGIIGSGSALDGADGDPYPLFGIPVYDDEQQRDIYFKLYDHASEKECDVDCTILYQGNTITINSGEEHLEGLETPDYPIVLSFSSPVPFPSPTNVAVSNITGNSADVSWNSSSNAFDLRYAPIPDQVFQGYVTDPGAMANGADASWLKGSQATWGPGANYNLGYLLADDFTVSSETTLNTIEVYAYQTGSSTTSTFTGLYAQIYDGSPADGGTVIWGDLLTNIMTGTRFTNCYRGSDGTDEEMSRPIMAITASGLNIPLQPGTYWLAYSLAGSGSSGPWAVPYSEPGIGSVGEALQYNVSNVSWMTLMDSGGDTTYGCSMHLTFDNDTFNWKYVENITDKEYALTGLEPSTAYAVQVRAKYDDDNASQWQEAVFTTLPSCIVPTGLTISNIGTYSANLTWTANGGETAWQICLNGDEDNLINVTESASYSFSGLVPETEYTVKVRACCDDTEHSKWSKAVTFTTLEANPVPVALTVSDITPTRATISWTGSGESYKVKYRKASHFNSVVFTEGFENGIGAWTLNNCGKDTKISDTKTHSGNNAFMFDRYVANYTAQTQYLISPELTGVTDGMKMEFYYSNLYSTDNGVTFKVGFSSESGNLSDFTFGEIITTSDRQWQIYSESIPADTKYVCWEVISTGTWTLHIDDIIIGVEDVFASLTPTEPTVTITGLKPQTAYEYQVQSVLGQLVSDWTPLATFTTLEANPVPTDLDATTTFTTATLSWTGYGESYNVKCSNVNGQSDLAILSQDFESGLNGWTRSNCGQYSNVDIYSKRTGEQGFRFTYLYNPPQYLISPALSDVTDYTRLDFYYKNSDSGKVETFQVGYSSTPSDTDQFTFGETITASNTQWQHYSAAIPAGTKYICFKHLSENQGNLFIDDITVTASSTTFSTPEATATITDLTPGAEYQYQVQSVYGGVTSEWSEIATFSTKDDNPVPTDMDVSTTHATATISWTGISDSYQVRYRPVGQSTVVHLSEGFESGNSWTRRDCNNNSNRYNGQHHSGSMCFRFCYHNDGKTTPQYLISPELPEQTNTLQFYYRSLDWNMEKFRVGFSSTTNATDAFIFGDEYSTADYTWHLFSQDIPADTKYICLMYTSNKYNLLIDDIAVTKEWDTASSTESMVTLTGLDPETTYEYQIQSILGTKASQWSPVATFTTMPPVEITLVNNATDNTSQLANYTNGVYANVTLSGRELYKDNYWNTLCLPFSIADINAEGSTLAGAIVRELDDASISGTTLTLNFKNPTTTIKAGTPYIVKWEVASNSTITDPVFSGVTIDKTDNSYDNKVEGDTRVRFLGTYDAVTFNGEGFTEDRSILFLSGNNTLYYPQVGVDEQSGNTVYPFIGACRAYFIIGNDGAGARLLTAFKLNFGDGEESQGIGDAARLNNNEERINSKWYTVDGRKLDTKPTKKGLYIHGGKKVVVP